MNETDKCVVVEPSDSFCVLVDSLLVYSFTNRNVLFHAPVQLEIMEREVVSFCSMFYFHVNSSVKMCFFSLYIVTVVPGIKHLRPVLNHCQHLS